MNYGRLGSPESIPSVTDIPFRSERRALGDDAHRNRRRRRLFLVGLFCALFLVAGGAAAAFLAGWGGGREGTSVPTTIHSPSKAVSRACGMTRFPSLCVSSLLNFPGAVDAGEKDLVHLSVSMTLQRVSRAFYGASAIANVHMDTRLRTAYEDCIELLDDSIDHLSRAALTNHDTCTEGLSGATGGYVKDQMVAHLRDLSELVSNCLAIFSITSKNKERRLMSSGSEAGGGPFPVWMNRRDRRLLQVPAGTIPADIVVSKDGNGTFTTIEEAVKAAPEYSSRRFIIYIRAGRYDENIKVGRKKTNLMFVGDGKGKTIIAGARSVFDNFTTFHTATFELGWPGKHQAVALRVGADHAVVYRCNVIGYQDTLYVHSQRQFFRECDIYGTVDFIFGNAAVVLQNCSIYSRKPMDLQKNTITAQNRKDPNQNTGISIHASRILAAADLLNCTKGTTPPSSAGHGSSTPWNATFALDTLYYGEYMNYGPGAAVGKRVTWPGFRVITVPEEASKFTVAQFIYGSSWLPSTGVAFLAGLST
ncbi:unnamed protein product [Spirodela intermedia]|uniref:Pectinesterase n=1 Tax=Spirodela intermedia TaxID=51605 RepID=A0A7I8J669_SPIIN|nr:unnamed protein product [Spirodela intermedia]CAA6665736.1 unnamed protein product [Spirodela intermedia]